MNYEWILILEIAIMLFSLIAEMLGIMPSKDARHTMLIHCG
jgi:hypothetical protein